MTGDITVPQLGDTPPTPQEPPAETPPAPAPPEGMDAGDASFLDMVRQANEGRQGEEDGKKQEQTEKGQKEEKGEGQEKVLTPPPTDEAPKDTKADNIRNLRNSLKAEKEKASQLEAQIEELKNSKKELPEEVQSTLDAYEKDKKKIEKYESLLGLYQSEGFKETYYDGVDNLVAEAKKIADDYQVSHEIIDGVFAITNRKQMIEALSEHFDIHTAGELRDKVLTAQALIKEREAAEVNPEKAKQELLSTLSEKSKAEKKKAFKDMGNLTQAAWHKMLDVYGDSNTGIEVLKEIPGDKSHMEKRDQLLGQAQSELGKVLEAFVASGLKSMPEGLAQALVARFQLSEVTGVLHAENQTLREQVDTLQSQLDKESKYSRPLANGKPAPAGAAIEGDVSGDKIASHVMSKAIEKTQAQ